MLVSALNDVGDGVPAAPRVRVDGYAVVVGGNDKAAVGCEITVRRCDNLTRRGEERHTYTADFNERDCWLSRKVRALRDQRKDERGRTNGRQGKENPSKASFLLSSYPLPNIALQIWNAHNTHFGFVSDRRKLEGAEPLLAYKTKLITSSLMPVVFQV